MPASREKSRDQFGDAQAVGRASDLGRARNNFRGIADRVHLNNVVDIVALNLPGHAREGNQIVGDDDNVVGVDRIGKRKAKGSASGFPVRAIAVAEDIRGRRRNDRDVNVNFSILNRLPAAAV